MDACEMTAEFGLNGVVFAKDRTKVAAGYHYYLTVGVIGGTAHPRVTEDMFNGVEISDHCRIEGQMWFGVNKRRPGLRATRLEKVFE